MARRLRALIENLFGDRTGHFLLLGSAALDLMRQASETVIGRVVYVDLAPIDALELSPRVGDLMRRLARR